MKRHRWGSVRKVRRVSQIEAILEFAIQNDGKPYSEEKLRQKLINEHIEVEKSRLRGMQFSRRNISSLRNSLLSLVKDHFAFGRSVGLFNMKAGRVIASKRTLEISRAFRDNSNDFRRLLLETILGSPYTSYLKFLIALKSEKGTLTLPAGSSQRIANSKLAKILVAKSIDIDIASFFTIRDLFYDFGLLNWFYHTKEDKETIIMTSDIRRDSKTAHWKESVKIPRVGYLVFDPEITPKEFGSRLVKAYFAISRQRWGAWMDILPLRDETSFRLRISDRKFNEMINAVLRSQPKGFTIQSSRGYSSAKATYGYGIKATNVPRTDLGGLIRYISILPKEVATI